MAPTPLNSSTTGNETWTIKVKVLRLWDPINLLTNELISTDVILLDKKVQVLHI